MAETADSRAWLTLVGLGLVATANPLGSGCGSDGPGDQNPIDEQAVTDVLAAVGPEVVIPTLDAFATRSGQLEAAIEQWQIAIAGGGDTATSKAAAQDAFLVAMEAWQEAELHQIGPAGSSLNVAGGEDLRDEIYSWPTINPCRVDQETVEAGWSATDFFSANLVNSYGLDALEHLLFADASNACSGDVDINADGSWDALGPAAVEQNRADFALTLALGVGDNAELLRDRWDSKFSETLATAAGGNDVYSSAQDGLNAVYEALFYLEFVTKDRKIKDPLDGLEDVEGLEAGDAVPRVRANLVGFRALFSGGSGHGIDDLLDELGHGDLATQILEDTDAAIAVAEGLDGPPDQALYDAVKLVSDAIKGDLATVLTLQIPSEAAGDAD